MEDKPVTLTVGDVWKRYGATEALAGVGLQLRQAEIHALLGGNGSGKSTLIKVLAGVEHADRGTVSFRGQPSAGQGPKDWLSVVHQHESTFPTLSVAENLAAGAGFGTRSLGKIRWSELRTRSQEVLDRFEIDASATQRLGDLGPATQKMVAIARALARQPQEEPGVLVLDEPTAALPAPEVATLLTSLKRYASSGWAILYVSHRLEELPGFADRATFLRDGRVTDRAVGAEIDLRRLVASVTGHTLEEIEHSAPVEPSRSGERRLVLDGVSGGAKISDVSLAVGEGEIVGLAGLVGSGRSSLLRIIFGSQSFTAGTIRLDDRAARTDYPGQDPDVAYIPEDRAREATFPMLSVKENLSAPSVGRFWKRGVFARRRERREAARLVEEFSIKTASIDAPIGSLSGGNQQKVILARWMCRKPRVLLLDEPTQGVDVGSRNEIHTLVRHAAAEGAAVLVASSDFEELASLCGRVVVLVKGRVVADVSGDEVTPGRISTLAQSAGLDLSRRTAR